MEKQLLDNYGRPRSDYTERLAAMDEAALFDECKQMIWLSAYAGNNPRSDYHWQCDATYAECARREKPEIYSRAHKVVSRDAK